MDKKEELLKLKEVIRKCQKCPLYQGTTQAVPGVGSPEAKIVFIGEAPGFYEDQKGEPFVGNAGHLLDDLLKGVGLLRDEVFITNIVKHRPPQNRDPRDEESLACKPWLDRQLEILKPKLIVTLGRISLSRFCPGQFISKVSGQERWVGDYLVFPLFHPAAALRDGRVHTRLESDFAKIPKLLDNLEKGKEKNDSREVKVEQEKLF